MISLLPSVVTVVAVMVFSYWSMRDAVSFSLELVTLVWLSLIEPMNELVTGSAGVTQSEGLKRLGLSEIIEIESSSAISDRILS